MLVKIHKGLDGRIVMAVCDNELLGKKFGEGHLQLDLSGSFYKGDKKTEKEFLELIRAADIVNAVGKRCVSCLVKNQLVSKENIIKINKIPHAQIVFD